MRKPLQPNACPVPEKFSAEYAKTPVFIHFLASSIFRELPSPSAKICYRPIVIFIYADIHPGLVTIPLDMEQEFTVPYGLMIANDPSPAVKRFISAVERIKDSLTKEILSHPIEVCGLFMRQQTKRRFSNVQLPEPFLRLTFRHRIPIPTSFCLLAEQ